MKLHAFAIALIMVPGMASAQQTPPGNPVLVLPAGQEQRDLKRPSINLQAQATPPAQQILPPPGAQQQPAVTQQAPDQLQAPGSAQPPLAQQNTLPPGAVPAQQAPAQRRALTRQELDRLRRGMVDETEGAIMTPEEIERIRRRQTDAQSAAQRPFLGQPPQTKGRVVGYPPVNEADGVPQITIAAGIVTPVTVTDTSGQRWPIVRWDYDTRVLSVDGSACGQGGGGLAGAAPLTENTRPHIISIMPCRYEVFANLVLYLEQKTTPVVLLVRSGDYDRVDLPVRIAVDGRSPWRDPNTPAPVARGDPEPRRDRPRTPQPQEDRSPPDRLFGDLLTGSTRQGVVQLRNDGDARTYAANGRLYLVCRCHVLNPAYDASGTTRDGDVRIFRFNEPTGRVLVTDGGGVERPINIEF